ncbi:hypothetical protein P364_0109965 [Paenibacillus sp. MAEPY2]|nr:hypothetical protein P363_0125940 [Paenibacillus sp. MAEPY1]KGP83192.1 hypothetical protein P364_0109965 [Paenibacillus sp. MAEPY2]
MRELIKREKIRATIFSIFFDILDYLGLRYQSMDPFIRPLDTESVVVEQAKTLQVSDVTRIPNNLSRDKKNVSSNSLI